MSRGLGRIERVIAARIASDAAYPMAVRLGSGQLAHAVYRPAENSGAGIGNPGTLWSWKPNLVQRKATARAMHSFVRKHQQYALVGRPRAQEPLPVRHRRPGQRHVGEVERQAPEVRVAAGGHRVSWRRSRREHEPARHGVAPYHQPRRSNGARANISIRVSSGP